ncbi:2-isopropylmalate synthase [Basidiobolus meristosporus CBS 931.73]|uniref:2-isopropylmalate synthase n=1 Tax=Basidiobolus meristosporus CBS 931.73 TaxID=1314790 RepID=A0A1Y1XY92_9FUNG|nr:2-isopropylmalate synthase [Basidiobolus meristosporus CBS 931.73]|eukprot:ORX90720.1 2-isopropylmalate synthase [Basidiobolus meristosporus CBS 931.73]
MAKDKLYIFDTTLRDGEQSPGVNLTANEKVEIAKLLSKMGVDICEAGFPMSSDGDFEGVKRIAKEVGPLMEGREKIGKPMVICGLSRATKGDIQRTYDAVKYAPLHRIHIFLATSDIHLEYKLKIDRQECIRRAVEAVKFGKSLCDNIEFSPEDAARTDKDFLCEVLGNVIEAGATTLNIPDTVGICVPEEYGALFRYLRENTKGSDKVIWSAHCQNDLGLATANTLSAISNGVRQVEVTINGIGERAGNTSLEEVVMSLYTHPDHYPVYNDIDTTHIYRISQLVIQRSGMPVQPNKAIVGVNAFAHESGIHQDGVLKNKLTYEIIAPEIVGVPSNNLVLGKHSGRNALKNKLEELHISLNDAEFQQFFLRFKKLTDAKKTITEQDILALAGDEFVNQDSLETYKIQNILITTGSDVLSTATVTLHKKAEGKVLVDAAIGHGPIQAAYFAINRLIGRKISLKQFEIQSVGSGDDALGKVFVSIVQDSEDKEAKSKAFAGHGTHNDIIQASVKAYVNAINRMIETERK